MRPVNLLPARYRPRTAGSGDPNRAYFALGALGLVVLAIFGYIMSANKVTSTNSEIKQAEQQIAAAQSRAVTFQQFGDFASVKEARLAAVKSLASARLDWERVFRELARVLPNGAWLIGFEGRAGGPDGTSGSDTDATDNTIALKGCAESHRQIADVLVRLRELHVAEDVELTETTAPQKQSGDAPAAAAAATSGGAEACGQYFQFEASVTVTPDAAAPAEADGAQTVPASLGGGQ